MKKIVVLAMCMCAYLGLFAQEGAGKDVILVDYFTYTESIGDSYPTTLRHAVIGGLQATGRLVIIDADAKQTLTHEMMHGAVDYTSYEGTDLHGKIDLVMQRGNIIAENNEFKGNRGDGKYLYRKPFLGDL